MPLYEYRCSACGKQFELIQKFSDPAPDQCPKCGKGPAERLMSSPAIQFKGTGWYITDYAKRSGSDSESAAAANTEKKETKADTAGDAGAKSDATTKSDAGSKSAPAPGSPTKPTGSVT
jgi:putative FmdB family regulatory protein